MGQRTIAVIGTESIEEMPLDPARKPARQGDSSIVSVRKIIDLARNKPISMLPAIKLSAMTGMLFFCSFYPLNLFFLAWVAFVPVISLIQIPKPTNKMLLGIYLGGVVQFIPLLQWMRLGDPLMYIAWLVLGTYLAAYLPLFVGLSRIGIHRLKLPLVLVVPIVWTAGEVLRGYLFTGFSWYFIGHTQYRWLEMIQISDLTGSYGVSFIILMVNAAIALQLPMKWYSFWGLLDDQYLHDQYTTLQNSQPGFALKQTIASVLVFSLALGYGYWRRAEAKFIPGPRAALIQASVPASLSMEGEDPRETFLMHQALTAEAVLHQPDVIIWPEGMFRWPLFSRHPELTDAELEKTSGPIPLGSWSETSVHRTLQELSERANANLIVGIMSFDASKSGISHHNSAVYVEKQRGITARYDKQHLVIFGEYIPLLEVIPFLKIFSPIASEIVMQPGFSQQVFKQNTWEYVPDICYEDTVPQLISRGLNSTSTDQKNKILVNISNDGWFHGSSEHDQHLITSVFRAVENRAPMVRAVNMGISAIIDGDGAVLEPEHFIDGENLGIKNPVNPRSTMRDPKTGEFYRKLPLAIVSTVPLDPRRSFYASGGDWFGLLCCSFVTLLLGTKLVGRKLN